MASISSVTQFPTNSVSSMSPSSKLSPNFLKLMANSMRFPLKNSAKSKFAIGVQNKFNFSWRAASEDELDPESKDSSLQAPVVEKEELTEVPAVEELAEAPAVEDLTEAPVVEEEEPTEAPLVEEELTVIDSLKKQLVDTFLGTNGGLSATSETTAEIVELITLLEAKNPTPEPTKTLPLLNGKWILVFTSFLGLHPLLSSGTLPLAQVDEISQTIDSENFTVQNCVVFSSLGSKTSFTTNATFEVRSPKRVQIKFEEGIIGTPQLTESIELPESVEVLGQTIDLSPFKELITSVEDTASNVAKTISSQPPWKFSISQTNSESWLLTTYLDEELRISRGDRGEVFVLFKEGSPRLSS